MPEPDLSRYFAVLTEIGIIDQLARVALEARLPPGFLASHFGVLNHLVRLGGGQTPLDLARAFQVPKTTMTHTLAGLAKAGLIEMRPNPKDGRSKTVWITAAGTAFRDDAVAALLPDLQALAAAFPEDEVDALLPGLETLRKVMDAARD